MSCTSGFVDDVTFFFHNGPYRPNTNAYDYLVLFYVSATRVVIGYFLSNLIGLLLVRLFSVYDVRTSCTLNDAAKVVGVVASSVDASDYRLLLLSMV